MTYRNSYSRINSRKLLGHIQQNSTVTKSCMISVWDGGVKYGCFPEKCPHIGNLSLFYSYFLYFVLILRGEKRYRKEARAWRSTLSDCRESGGCWMPELYLLSGKNEEEVGEWKFLLLRPQSW